MNKATVNTGRRWCIYLDSYSWDEGWEDHTEELVSVHDTRKDAEEAIFNFYLNRRTYFDYGYGSCQELHKLFPYDQKAEGRGRRTAARILALIRTIERDIETRRSVFSRGTTDPPLRHIYKIDGDLPHLPNIACVRLLLSKAVLRGYRIVPKRVRITKR